MTVSAKLLVRVVVIDDNGNEQDRFERETTIADVQGLSGQRQTIALANGDNTITIPSGATLLIIKPSDNAKTLKIKGAAGDTGVTVNNTGGTATGDDVLPVVLSLGTTALIINASGATSIEAMFL